MGYFDSSSLCINNVKKGSVNLIKWENIELISLNPKAPPLPPQPPFGERGHSGFTDLVPYDIPSNPFCLLLLPPAFGSLPMSFLSSSVSSTHSLTLVCMVSPWKIIKSNVTFYIHLHKEKSRTWNIQQKKSRFVSQMLNRLIWPQWILATAWITFIFTARTIDKIV